jgi:cold shock protein
MQGTVTWFHFAKGYGFIDGEDGTDFFVHHTGIGFGRKGHKTLERGAKVTFDVESKDGKSQAVNVMPLEVVKAAQ